MKNLDFYYVDNEYIDYLKKAELETRGFTCVPNVEYSKNNKFMYGTVLEVNNLKFFVPVSSKIHKNKEYNLDIKIKDKKSMTKGSLRFPYMIPVPENCLNRVNISKFESNSKRVLLTRELNFCNKNQEKIEKIAQHTYNAVVSGNNKNLLNNSCDFKLLEQKCQEYIQAHQQEQQHILPNQIPTVQDFGGFIQS